jgi:3-oxoacyl-[acyl-carrier-protein] synthase-3
MNKGVHSTITGTGSYLPKERITNADLLSTTGLDDKGIQRRTGIRERRRASAHEATSDLATRAAEEALKAAQLTPQKLDYIVLSTTSPDMFFPSTACLVQRNLHASRASAFDISAGCAGFLVALSIADRFLKNPTTHHILVIASEVKTRFVNPADPKTAILFGDGAGAVILQKTHRNEGVKSILLKSDGAYHDLIKIPAGGSRSPTTFETLRQGQNTITMQGEALFRVAVQKTTQVISEILDENRLTLSEISHVILHQANLRLMKAIARRLKIRDDQLVIVLDKVGNTSSSSLPIALDILNKDQKLKGGEWILLAGFGAGLTWGAALLRWPEY